MKKHNNKKIISKYLNNNIDVITPHNVYLIDLNKFNITEGFRTRISNEVEYKSDDYAIAKANVEGIQNAIDYAIENNYEEVCLPKGEYSICYFPNYCINVGNITFNGCNSTLKVMFDSTHFNPYDTKKRICKNPNCENIGISTIFNDDGTCPICGRNYVYDVGNAGFGSMYVMEMNSFNCNKSIKNLHLIGDIYERTWTDFEEKTTKFDCEVGTENTYGICLDGINCTLENIETEGFMGDGITSSCKTRFHYTNYAFTIINDQPDGESYWGKLTYKLGGLTDDGIEIDNTQEQLDNLDISLRTAMLTINTNSYNKSEVPYVMCLVGKGYNRFPNLTDQNFYMYFYDENQKLIEMKIVEPWTNFDFPPNAKYVRGGLRHQQVETFSWALSFEVTHDCKICNCYSHDNHRGGCTGAGINYIFDNLKLYNNGLDSSIGCPLFPDTTRYNYNQEDSYSYRTIFRKCNISTSFNNMLLGLYHPIIEYSNISNAEYGSIILYKVRDCIIRNNTIEGGKIAFSDDSGNIIPRNIEIYDNNINNCLLNLGVLDNTNVYNNDIYNGKNIQANRINANNIWCDETNKIGLTLSPVNECDNNTITNIGTLNLSSSLDIVMNNNAFNNCMSITNTRNTNTISLYNCSINNCDAININSYPFDAPYIRLNKCEIKNSIIAMGSYINITDYTNLISSEVVIEDTTLDNCTIGCYYNNTAVDNTYVKLVFNNCVFNNTLIVKPLQIGKKFTMECNNCIFNLDELTNGYYIICNNCTFNKELPNINNVVINK